MSGPGSGKFFKYGERGERLEKREERKRGQKEGGKGKRKIDYQDFCFLAKHNKSTSTSTSTSTKQTSVSILDPARLAISARHIILNLASYRKQNDLRSQVAFLFIISLATLCRSCTTCLY